MSFLLPAVCNVASHEKDRYLTTQKSHTQKNAGKNFFKKTFRNVKTGKINKV